MSSPVARLLPVAAGGAVTLVAAIVVAVATGTGYVGALAGILVVLVLADLGYAWRTNRRRAPVDARTATALRRAGEFAQVAEARNAELRAALERVETGQAELREAVATLAETAEIAVVEARMRRAAPIMPNRVIT